jgi:hypothetical protein
MLTCSEYSVYFGVPVELSPEMGEMAMFTLDLGDCRYPTPLRRPTNSDELPPLGEPLTPALAGIEGWSVTPKVGEYDDSLWRAKQLADADKERDRQANLAVYLERGYAFEPLPEGGMTADDGIPRKRKLPPPQCTTSADVSPTTMRRGSNNRVFDTPTRF